MSMHYFTPIYGHMSRYYIQYNIQYTIYDAVFSNKLHSFALWSPNNTGAYFEFWFRMCIFWILNALVSTACMDPSGYICSAQLCTLADEKCSAQWCTQVHNDAHRCSAHTCNRWIYMQCTALHFGRCPIRRDKKGGVAQIGEEYSMNIAHPYSHQSQQLIVSEGVFKMSLSFCWFLVLVFLYFI